MLPHLNNNTSIDAHANQFCSALKKRGFSGDIELDLANRAVQSVDNSIYQQFPSGILYPRSHNDISIILLTANQPAFADIVFAARGGATGTNGQSLTSGWVIDLSRHMNRILEINVEGGWARVQAGVVKDALNNAVKQHGLFFAPDLSTSSRATIGGMINTDASGQGSAVYGKTSDHIISTTSVLSDGSTWHCQSMSSDALHRSHVSNKLLDTALRRVADIVDQQAQLIENSYPKLQRAVTGYDLARIRQQQADCPTWDFNRLICGSEGTLAIVTEAIVNLEPIAKHTQLFVCSYNTIVEALHHNERLNQFLPLSIETIDDKVIALAEKNILWNEVKSLVVCPGGGVPGAISFIEIMASDEEKLSAEVARFEDCFESTKNQWLNYQTLHKPEDRANLLALRKKAVGLLGSMQGQARPVPFVEDVAVPTPYLADFITDFKQLLDRHHLTYGIFGHADAGVMHVRPALNLRDPSTINMVRRISDEVFSLVRRYGGVIWGEHGKGVRSEYSPATFGELYPYLQQVKQAFDPHNKLNPGKIATPNAEAQLTKIDELSTRGQRDNLISVESWEAMAELPYCNGNGTCFDWNPNTTLCPSFKASGQRLFSPKGRSQLIKEWLAQLGEKHYNVNTAPVSSIWHLPKKIMNHFLAKTSQTPDFSQQVLKSMETCLGCKACATQCPIHVDIPAARSQFYAHYYTRYLRPVRHFFIAHLEKLLPIVARTPRVYQFATESQWGRHLAERLIGLVDLPPLSQNTLQTLAGRYPMRVANERNLQRLDESERPRAVIILQDSFNHYFDASVVADTYQCIERLGFIPFLAPLVENGKALNVLGYEKAFAKTAQNTAAILDTLSKYNIPMIGIDPSITLSYRHEHAKVLGYAPPVMLLQEWLIDNLKHLQWKRQHHSGKSEQAILLLHCTEASQGAQTATQWESIFNRLGFSLIVKSTGCCGMAGVFGLERKNQSLSKRAYQLSWQQIVEDHPNALLVTGFSCRSQISRFGHTSTPLHPMQWLLLHIAKADRENERNLLN